MFKLTKRENKMKTKQIKNFKMNDSVYKLRRKVIDLIYEVKSQIKSFMSAPQINFGYKDAPNKIVLRDKTGIKDMNENLNKNVLTDLKNIKEIKGNKRGETSEEIEYFVENPFTKNKKAVFSKILASNKRTGETVISSLIVKNIENQFE